MEELGGGVSSVETALSLELRGMQCVFAGVGSQTVGVNGVDEDEGIVGETFGEDDSGIETVTESVCNGSVSEAGMMETFSTTGSRKETVRETFAGREEAGILQRGSSILLKLHDGWRATVTGEIRSEGVLN